MAVLEVVDDVRLAPQAPAHDGAGEGLVTLAGGAAGGLGHAHQLGDPRFGDQPRRRRIRATAEQIRSAGLDPRVIGLVTEPRITELMGVSETTGRSTRQRDKAFPRAVVRGRLWCEPDVIDYLAHRQETSPRPGALF